MQQASGTLFRVRGSGECLFLQRSSAAGDHVGEWCVPGGGRENDETAEETAVREAQEEVGAAPDGYRKLLTRQIANDVDFATFLQEVDAPFDVTLNDEHVSFVWAPADSAPQPLHPGVDVALRKLSANELDVAKMMRDGEITSPQIFSNMLLVDLRITGTGVAYRTAHDEYCYRSPENYMTPEFLERCNGLAVLWEHPEKATLDSKEWADRVVGTVFLPYLKKDVGEVWAIAKIYDAMAIEELTSGEAWSTSPTVDFGAGVVLQDVNAADTMVLEDGSEIKMLREGEAPLLDHVAICPKGVWDRMGPPTGVNTARADGTMAEEDDKKRDDAAAAAKAKADAEDDKFRKIMDAMGGVSKLADSVASLHARMDSWDEEKKKSDAAKANAAKAKADEGEKEEKKANEAADEPGASDPKEVERKKSDAKKSDEDDDKDKKDDKAKADAAKAKADEDEKKREDAARRADAARADSLAAEVADLKRRLDAQHRSDDDRNALGAAHARADSTYQQWGRQAPSPYPEESLLSYRRRIANDLKIHSQDWKDSDLARMDMASFGVVENRIYADAVLAARNPASFSDGELRQVKVPDAYGIGHRIEFHGKPSWWMDDFKQQPLKAKFRRHAASN